MSTSVICSFFRSVYYMCVILRNRVCIISRSQDRQCFHTPLYISFCLLHTHMNIVKSKVQGLLLPAQRSSCRWFGVWQAFGMLEETRGDTTKKTEIQTQKEDSEYMKLLFFSFFLPSFHLLSLWETFCRMPDDSVLLSGADDTAWHSTAYTIYVPDF